MTSPYPNFSTPLTFANTTVQSPAVPATPTPAGRGRPRGSGTGAKRGRKPKNPLGTNSPRVASPAPGSSTASPVFSTPQHQQLHWATNATGDDAEGSLLQGGISRRNSSQSQVVGTEQGDGSAVIGGSVGADGQPLITGASGSVPPQPIGTRPPGADEDADVDDELLPAMADDDYSAQQSWNTQSKDNLKILMDSFTPDQYERFEAYRRHALPKQAVRKVVQQTLGQQVSQPVAQIVAGFSKYSDAVTPYVSDTLKGSNFAKGLATAFLGYLTVVRMLRFKRYRDIHRKYQKKYEERTLTPEEAQKVMFVSAGYDMPLVLNYSLAFALFKTYAIPSISKLLAATKQLKSSETVSKRYADTELMISTWVGCPISGYTTEDKSGELDPRAMIALARVNQLHSKYNISNGDYLYTLILFAVEPATWARKYGWRELSPLEEYAYCIFWVEIGKRMGIQDIPETPEDMRAWARAYEQEQMVPDPINNEVANYTTEELLYPIPTAFGIRNWFDGLTVCMLDEPVRIAMMKPAQPLYKYMIIWCLLRPAAFVQKWLMLPRSDTNYRFPSTLEFNRKEDGSINPRMYPRKFQVRPWYKPEPTTVFGRVWAKFLVLTRWHSHLPSLALHSDGYRLEEMGPMQFEKVGNSEAVQEAEKLLGCPITGAFAR
ncbi:hypothetical protein D9756_010264 [Leucocoprinus leucothites]|uniref:ER-bound oxygenase mpaB/mpaB'/Rubber oxygenase catalytic domain-containing protein n=1 Tax=Leucocoprinus leucothites TaxID=201217 RepID=A0A8H5CTS4_9AGAR|nr:hypothetical protein D9756_010264 [Leucoagaricus leucothites]